MPRNHETCSKSRRNVSKKYRKLTSSDDETEKCRRHTRSSSKPRKCGCCLSDNEETEEKTNFRKRMISILSPAVSHKNLATILSTDNSELFQSKPKPGCDESRKSRKKCSKHAVVPSNERSKSNSRVRVKHNENCRKKIRHQCTEKPPKRPVNPPKCPGCSKEFDSPILLSCGHTLCRHCVAMFVEASNGSFFKCPVCETEIRLSGDEEELFCPNFMTLRQIEHGGDNSTEDLLCAVCQSDIEADYYCDTCQDLLCCNCANAHQVVKYTKGHRVRDIDCSTDVSSLVKKRYYCVDHENELLNTFCVPCQKCVCKKCASLFHRGTNHQCIPVASAAQKAKDEMRRQLYEFKSRSPNLQLALMDLQHSKKTLKEQANVTYAEISDSMGRIISAIKEHEKKLHKRLEDVCQTKVSALKSQKHQIVNQLERFETLTNILQELDQHDNNVETLQMRATIRTCAEVLEKDPLKLKCSQSSIFFNSNELKVKSEVEKHGEIFHITSNDGRRKSISDLSNERNDYIISNFAGRVSFPVKINAETDLDLRKNAKKIRAKSNWKILRSRLPEVINSSRPPRAPIHGETSRRRNTRKKQISRARREKARANWTILRSHLSDVTESDIMSPRAKPRIIKSLKKPKINYRSMRVKALRQRANANWLLVRSMLSDIVDFGRVTGRVFSPMKFTAYKQRSSPTIMKLKRFRAKKLRARANWLLVASRVKDIVRYPDKLRRERVTWDSYLVELNMNRRKATRNKYVAGVLRARANWMLVRSRIPDIILYGKYRRYSKKELPESRHASPVKTKSKPLKRSESDRVRSRRTEKPIVGTDKLQRSSTKHRNNDDEKRRKHHQHRSTKIKSPRHSRKGATQIALENWSKLVQNTQQAVKRTPSTKSKLNKEVYKSWDDLIQRTSTSDKKKKVHRSSSTRRKQNALNNWDNLTAHTNTKDQQKSKKALDNWDQLVKKTKGTNVQRSSSLKSKGEAPHKNWDILIQNTSREIKQRSSLRSKDAFMNWDNLLRSKNTDQKKSLENWDHLIVGTSTLSSPRRAKSVETLSRRSQSEQHWHDLFDSAKREKRNADGNWHRLTGNAHYEKEAADRNWGHLVHSTKTPPKSSNRAKKGWDKIRTSLGRNLTHKADKGQPVMSQAQEDRAYKNWWTLISTDEDSKRPAAEEDIRDKAARTRQMLRERTKKRWKIGTNLYQEPRWNLSTKMKP
ncbi:uncharacterized protein [Clytia hemisphaerica]|uniref:Uncharacterized protein n=1 Tax=Clytia hemisphaerica TaxID=252671 RepID=A0A7M5WVT3_9CNID